MMGNEGISVADAIALRNSDGNYNGGGYGGFGDNGAWWIVILILLFAGWGRGFGNNNGGNGGDNFYGYNNCCTPATAQGMTDAFNFNQLDNGQRSLERGLCDGFYSTNNAINAVGSALQQCCCDTKQAIANLGFQTAQGINGVDKTIMQEGFRNQTGFNSLANQLASCCCDIERGQDAIRCEIGQVANQLLVASDKNTDRIINYLTQTEMDKLRTELQSAQFQLSQNSQTNSIVDRLMPVAKPAYLTCSPYASSFGFGFNGFNGFGSGCGGFGGFGNSCNSCC